MDTNINRALVLGSNSFTGAHFINYLLEQTNAEVIGFSRSEEYNPLFLPYLYGRTRPKRFKFYQLDIQEKFQDAAEICDAFRPEIVVNYAAQGEVRNSWNWPEQWYRTNCLTVVRLAEFLKQKKYLKKYIAISTPEVYGATVGKMKERHFYHPSTPYAASKLAGDLHLMALHKRYDFPVVFSRTANVYGIHQQLYRIIPRAIMAIKSGSPLVLHGHGLTRRAFIHVRDVADFTLRLALKGRPGEVYHLTPNEGLLTIAAVVRKICAKMGGNFKQAVRMTDENFGQDCQYNLDAGKAKTELAWSQQVDFTTGLDETIAWILGNWTVIQKMPQEYMHIAS